MVAYNNSVCLCFNIAVSGVGITVNGKLKAKPARSICKMHATCMLTICNIQGVSFIAGLLAAERAASLLHNDR